MLKLSGPQEYYEFLRLVTISNNSSSATGYIVHNKEIIICSRCQFIRDLIEIFDKEIKKELKLLIFNSEPVFLCQLFNNAPGSSRWMLK